MRRFFGIVSALMVLNGCSLLSSSHRSGQYRQYTVRRGDTLIGIADRFGVSSAELANHNDVDDPRTLQVGQLLQVPSQSRRTPLKNALERTSNDRASLTSRGAVLENAGATPVSRLGRPTQVNLGGVRNHIRSLLNPVPGARITSQFGYRWLRFHEGLDLAAPEGTHVRAAHDGTVVYLSDRFGAYGKVIVIKGGNLLTVYAHNLRNRVSVGESIRRGEWIADVGQTGDATGPHLHFETRVRDEKGRYAAVDPIPFIQSAEKE